jgi:cytoskeleton protein RodZ
VTADGKSAFTGTLQPNETREISAAEQVKILTGNAGALTIALNGKPLAQMGSLGEVRGITLTAEGPQLLRAPPPLPDDAL